MLNQATVIRLLLLSLCACTSVENPGGESGRGGGGGTPTSVNGGAVGAAGSGGTNLSPSRDAGAAGMVSESADASPGTVMALDAQGVPAVDARASQRDVGSGDAPGASIEGSRCAQAGFPVCLDFEDGQWPTAWRSGTEGGGKVAVEGTRSRRGARALHLTLPVKTGQSGGNKAYLEADLPAALRGATHWGRAFMWMKGPRDAGVPSGHGSLVETDGTDTSKGPSSYNMGVQFQRFMGNYVRQSPFEELVTECKSAGDGCSNDDASKALIPTDRWVCVEWQFDGATGQNTRIFTDGVALALNHYGTPIWRRMEGFTHTRMGLLQYWPHPAVDMWLDEIALASTRIGCDK